MAILTVNAGSSSLKLALLGADDELLAEHELQASQASVDDGALAAALEDLGDIDAVGHRIVHGGARFTEAVRVDGAVVAALRALSDLAPLHQRKSLAALEAVSHVLPGVPAVACFDTAFHATLPAAATTYALPRRWREHFGLRRYGFHGLSHAYASRRAREMLAPRSASRIVTCHLGAGASLAAVRDGVSVDTTMGFTPLDGLVMATRGGSVDPGILLWLLEHGVLGESELADALEHDSGLVGLAGTGDMRELLARDDEQAELALEVYLHRLRASIAAMTATLGGVDALVFTGGVGQHSPPIRARAAAGLGYLGVQVDARRNEKATGDAEVGAAAGSVGVLVVAAREDLEIARQTREVLA
ncbi:MAG: acetate/propionate family kinase [Solirubrobacteraceae bacterium]